MRHGQLPGKNSGDGAGLSSALPLLWSFLQHYQLPFLPTILFRILFSSRFSIGWNSFPPDAVSAGAILKFVKGTQKAGVHIGR
jgi:hypothetical protein